MSRFDAADYLGLALNEVEVSRGAHLSLRHAISAAVAIDRLPDKVFAAHRRSAPHKLRGALDLPQYRQRLHAACNDLELLYRLCCFDREGPHLCRRAVAVTEAHLEQLDIADFMVCVYNGHAVETIMLCAGAAGERVFAAVLADAAAFWKKEFSESAL